MKQILYITYDGLTDPLGQSQVLPYIVALSAAGYKFTIVSFEKKQRLAKEKKIIEDITSKSGIEWQPLIFTRRPPLLSKIYDRWKLRRKVLRLHRKKKFDLIHCRSYVAAELGLWLKRKSGVKFLFDMRGFWADEKIDNGQWNQANPIYKKVYEHYKGKERSFLLEADGIISLTHAAKRELQKNLQYKHLKIDVIPCCADLDHFDYDQHNNGLSASLREQTGISKDQRIITYLGSVGGWYMTKEMFAFFRKLQLRYPDFILMILTKDEPGRIIKEAEDAGIPKEKVRVLYAGRNELPDYISLSACSIFFIRPTYSKIASSPTKHAELMGMGIPVICNDIGDTGKIIEESGTGMIVRQFNEQEYDRVINSIEELLRIPREKIRDAAMRYFDLESGAGDYLKIYRRILAE